MRGWLAKGYTCFRDISSQSVASNRSCQSITRDHSLRVRHERRGMLDLGGRDVEIQCILAVSSSR
jgi:tRNA(Ser,Leu) C12 N-acetylase TAN1